MSKVHNTNWSDCISSYVTKILLSLMERSMYFSHSYSFLLLTSQWVWWVGLFYASGIAFYSSCLSDYQLLPNHSQGAQGHPKDLGPTKWWMRLYWCFNKDTRESLAPKGLRNILTRTPERPWPPKGTQHSKQGHPKVLGPGRVTQIACTL